MEAAKFVLTVLMLISKEPNVYAQEKIQSSLKKTSLAKYVHYHKSLTKTILNAYVKKDTIYQEAAVKLVIQVVACVQVLNQTNVLRVLMISTF